ncbi:JmjC domain-containing histone demethylation protein 1 [Cryptococcus bacillisporus CA1873]|uniref:JmjC domain-containing histone demethylation protein 1 n=1 Tax=Cryptococcus bacillisporus CA1873 TaxID=1296111 RepID=A0ABR5BFD6_CRYGA|nr:JmjC domain-containing histone demethylation protein 1 [Cryptococcus bacillisporus CA1873]|eukprot:KIR67901.1 JmjC domain-containing histone demethylation protein 1 [Cryptococcus gattii CA1873]
MSEEIGQREAADSPQDTAVKTPPEPCPLCRETGPPQPPSITEEGKTNDDIDLVWIACNKCNEWYHSACLFLGGEKWRETIPKEIISTVQTNFGDEGAWTNWVEWIGKWYCAPCLARATSPSNPRPPRHPLVATMKRASIQPKDIDQAGKPLKRSATISAPPLRSNIKRPRTSTKDQEAVSPDIEMKNEREQQGRGTVGTPGSDAPQGRPKRKTAQIDYRNLNNSIATPTHQWLELIADPEKYGRTILDANYPSLPGKLLTRAWLESQPLPGQPSSISPNQPPTRFWGPNREPLIVRPEDGGFSSLGGHLPPKDLTVQDVANLVGPDRMVDVIDVSSQHSSPWTLQKWAEYIQSSAGNTNTRNPKVYNIISLEISGTELAKKVKPPKIVREIDWVDNFWRFSGGAGGKDVKEKGRENDSREGSEMEKDGSHLPEGDTAAGDFGENLEDLKEKANAPYPKAQLYCLDWHVDFAASSVYYTIHSGAKVEFSCSVSFSSNSYHSQVFFFIKPTEQNLKAYAEWSGSYEKQQDTWLGDMVDEVRKVELHAGDTMIIPTGYIHAVYTPMDSIVFGGNFLHSYNVDTQLRLRQIEIDTKVPQRFRFPMFDRLCWYVADKYCSDLRHLRAYRPRASTIPKPPHFRVLQCLSYLANFLVSQTEILDDPEVEDKVRKLVHDRIPGDIVKDPEGLARELKWRVERELAASGLLRGEASGVGAEEPKSNGDVNGSGKIKGKDVHRKKDRLSKVFDKKAASRTWDFHPPAWSESRQSPQIETSIVQLPRPTISSSGAISGSGPGASAGASADAGENEGEQAELMTMLVKQNRKRLRKLDNGTVIEESQETTFVEKRTVWGPEFDKEKVSQPQGKQEENMDIDH